jgi:hypothetical protein
MTKDELLALVVAGRRGGGETTSRMQVCLLDAAQSKILGNQVDRHAPGMGYRFTLGPPDGDWPWHARRPQPALAGS